MKINVCDPCLKEGKIVLRTSKVGFAGTKLSLCLNHKGFCKQNGWEKVNAQTKPKFLEFCIAVLCDAEDSYNRLLSIALGKPVRGDSIITEADLNEA